MKIAAIAIFLLSTFAVNAQTKTFKWGDEACDYQGTYDSKAYTALQLADTQKLVRSSGFPFSTDATVFKYDDVARLDLGKLDAEYALKVATLNGLDIVKNPYFENLRAARLAEIRQVYELSRASMQAYANPDILNSFKGAESCKTKFAIPLAAGGDKLLAAWQDVNAEMMAKGDAVRLKKDYDEHLASPDKMKFAQVEVMTFGWWNCANATIKYVENDGSQDREFKKLFVRVKKMHCDAP